MLKQRVSRRMRKKSHAKQKGRLALGFPEPDGELRQFWQARFYDFNVFTEKKKREKLEYMHWNGHARAGDTPEGLAMEQLVELCAKRKRADSGRRDVTAVVRREKKDQETPRPPLKKARVGHPGCAVTGSFATWMAYCC